MCPVPAGGVAEEHRRIAERVGRDTAEELRAWLEWVEVEEEERATAASNPPT